MRAPKAPDGHASAGPDVQNLQSWRHLNGRDDLVHIFRVLPDGSTSPLREAVPYGRATAASGPLEEIEDIPKAVVAVLLPPPSRHLLRTSELPPAWTDEVVRWLSAREDETVWAGALGTEVAIAPSELRSLARPWRWDRS